jgi:hypothetical protein
MKYLIIVLLSLVVGFAITGTKPAEKQQQEECLIMESHDEQGLPICIRECN